MQGLGGTMGAVLSAFFTQYLTPSHTFFFVSFFGLAIAGIGSRIDISSESSEDDLYANENLGFC